MEVIINEIIIGKFEYDTAICKDGTQVVINKGQDKFAGKKVKIVSGVCTEITEPVKEPVKTQQPVKKFAK